MATSHSSQNSRPSRYKEPSEKHSSGHMPPLSWPWNMIPQTLLCQAAQVQLCSSWTATNAARASCCALEGGGLRACSGAIITAAIILICFDQWIRSSKLYLFCFYLRALASPNNLLALSITQPSILYHTVLLNCAGNWSDNSSNLLSQEDMANLPDPPCSYCSWWKYINQ